MDVIEVVKENPVVVIETDASPVVLDVLAGVQGVPGLKGDKGDAATIAVGTVTTGAPGTTTTITNSGTSGDAVLDFVIPRGDKGEQGIQGIQGPQGIQGQAATIAVGTVSTGAPGSTAAITNSGTSGDAVFNFSIPRGDKGDAATVALGTVSTGAPGSAASITNSGTPGAAVFNFSIPRGDVGATGPTGPVGPAGPANTLTIGTVTTVAYGGTSSATITGTSPNQTLNLTLVSGPQGPKGDPGTGSINSVNGDVGPDVILDAVDVGAEPTITAGTISQYWRGNKTWATLDKAAVGLANVDNTSDAAKPISTATQNALNAKADLVGGLVPTSQLPPLAINEVFTVASQAAMLALTAQRGDMAIRTDNGKTYVLSSDSPGTLADWKEIMATGQVVSVAGKTGTVTLVKADVGLDQVDNTSDASKPVSTATQTALNAKENTIAAGTTAQYYRGDKTWQTLNAASVANAVSTDTAQTITGAKTFNNNLTINGQATVNGYTLVTLNVANDTSAYTLLTRGGTDATLGPLDIGFGVRPSATGSSRYGYISVGDAAAMRHLVLNSNGQGAFGRVGIGTVSPTEMLGVAGNIAASRIGGTGFSTQGNTDYFSAASINAGATGDAPHYGMGTFNFNDGNGTVGANTSLSGYFGISFVTAGVERMRIKYNGAVTIGGQAVVTTNDSRLSDARTPLTHSHGTGDITSGIMAPARLGTGTADATTYLRGDNTWQVISDPTVPIQAAAPTGKADGTFWYDSDEVFDGYANITRVLHNGTAYPARPTGATYVEWVGPVAPTAQITGDTWINTA